MGSRWVAITRIRYAQFDGIVHQRQSRDDVGAVTV
jgi:hypothetical protein